MKYHARLCIMVPRSHNHDQEGCTRCASTCDRYRNGGRYWYCWALEFCSSSSRRVSGVGVGTKLMLTSNRTVEFTTGNLFGLVVHVCIHHLAQRAEFAQTRYVSHTPHVQYMFWNTFQLSTSPLRSPITLFRCADVHCSPTPHPPHYIPSWLWNLILSNVFWKFDSLYTKFCGAQELYCMFYRRHFSTKSVPVKLPVQSFVLFVVITGERGTESPYFVPKDPTKSS